MNYEYPSEHPTTKPTISNLEGKERKNNTEWTELWALKPSIHPSIHPFIHPSTHPSTHPPIQSIYCISWYFIIYYLNEWQTTCVYFFLERRKETAYQIMYSFIRHIVEAGIRSYLNTALFKKRVRKKCHRLLRHLLCGVLVSSGVLCQSHTNNLSHHHTSS